MEQTVTIIIVIVLLINIFMFLYETSSLTQFGLKHKIIPYKEGFIVKGVFLGLFVRYYLSKPFPLECIFCDEEEIDTNCIFSTKEEALEAIKEIEEYKNCKNES